MNDLLFKGVSSNLLRVAIYIYLVERKRGVDG